MNYSTLRHKIVGEFQQDSAIAPQLFTKAVSIIPDVEFDPVTKEIISTPIADALHWKYTRFTREAKPNILAAEFHQENGNAPWQLKIFSLNGTASYYAPTGAGDIPFLPPVPPEIAERIAAYHGVAPPSEDESFWDWFKTHLEIPLVITEGGKKALAALSAGVVTIALYGCQCGAKRKDKEGNRVPLYLIPELAPFAKDRKVTVAFDEDTKKKTRATVRKATKLLCIALKKAGAHPFVARWNPADGKGIDDLIANKGPEAFYHALESAIPSHIQELDTLTRLTFTPNRIVNTRYLGNLNIPESAKVACLLSAKGTGKTHSIAELVMEAQQQGQPVLILSHRVQLCEEICQRCGVPYVTQLRDSVFGKTLGYGLCVDSLHGKSQARFNPADWHDALVIIDEVEQMTQHMLGADTNVKYYRRIVAENLQELLEGVTAPESKGKVIIGEADLSDISVKYILSLCAEGTEPWLLVNTWKPEQGYTVTHLDYKDPGWWLLCLIQHIEEGGRPLIFTDAQKADSTWSAQNLERLLRLLFPDKSILLIDSETVAEPDHPACGVVPKLNSELPQYDIGISSPAIETGVSIDIVGHFTSVWAKSHGVQSSNAFRQALDRLRDSVPRYLWVATQGLSIGSGQTNPYLLLREQKEEYNNLIEQLAKADELIEYKDNGREHAHLMTWARYTARVNAQRFHYREYTFFKIEQEGHRVERKALSGKALLEVACEIDTLVGMLKGIKEDNYRTQREETCRKENPSESRYTLLQAKKAKTKSERQEERKGTLSRRYGEQRVTPELMEQDDKGLYPQLNLHFYLTIGRHLVETRDAQKIRGQLRRNDKKLFTHDANRNAYTTQVAVLEVLGIKELLERPQETQFQNDDPLLVRIADIARTYAASLRAVFHRTIPANATNIKIVQVFLDKLGLKMPCVGRKGPRGSRQRIYGYPISKFESDGREEIFQFWLERHEEKNPCPRLEIEPEMETVDLPMPCAEGDSDDKTRVHDFLYRDIPSPSPDTDTGSQNLEPAKVELLDPAKVEEVIGAIQAMSQLGQSRPEQKQAFAKELWQDAVTKWGARLNTVWSLVREDLRAFVKGIDPDLGFSLGP